MLAVTYSNVLFWVFLNGFYILILYEALFHAHNIGIYIHVHC